MRDFIAIPEQLSASWLTAILRQARLLTQGEVLSFEQEATWAFNSQTSRLILRYSANAPSLERLLSEKEKLS